MQLIVLTQFLKFGAIFQIYFFANGNSSKRQWPLAIAEEREKESLRFNRTDVSNISCSKKVDAVKGQHPDPAAVLSFVVQPSQIL